MPKETARFKVGDIVRVRCGGLSDIALVTELDPLTTLDYKVRALQRGSEDYWIGRRWVHELDPLTAALYYANLAKV